MIFADTDFFLALMKESDWLKEPAEKLLRQDSGQIRILPTVLIEILLLARREMLDPERLLSDVLQIGVLDGYDPHMNLVLKNVEETYENNVVRKMESTIVRGDNVIYISP